MFRSSADEAAFVKLSRTQPKAKAIVQQHLHTVGAFVDEQVRIMGSRFTEHIHDASQRFIYSGTHVERFHRHPSRIDPDHLISSLSSKAHSRAADAGHSMLTLRPLRRTSMRIALSVG